MFLTQTQFSEASQGGASSKPNSQVRTQSWEPERSPTAPANQEHTRLFAATVGSSEAVEEQGSMLGKWLECALGEALSGSLPSRAENGEGEMEWDPERQPMKT